jgi:hypothetical protein
VLHEKELGNGLNALSWRGCCWRLTCEQLISLDKFIFELSSPPQSLSFIFGPMEKKYPKTDIDSTKKAGVYDAAMNAPRGSFIVIARVICLAEWVGHQTKNLFVLF